MGDQHCGRSKYTASSQVASNAFDYEVAVLANHLSTRLQQAAIGTEAGEVDLVLDAVRAEFEEAGWAADREKLAQEYVELVSVGSSVSQLASLVALEDSNEAHEARRRAVARATDKINALDLARVTVNGDRGEFERAESATSIWLAACDMALRSNGATDDPLCPTTLESGTEAHLDWLLFVVNAQSNLRKAAIGAASIAVQGADRRLLSLPGVIERASSVPALQMAIKAYRCKAWEETVYSIKTCSAEHACAKVDRQPAASSASAVSAWQSANPLELLAIQALLDRARSGCGPRTEAEQRDLLTARVGRVRLDDTAACTGLANVRSAGDVVQHALAHDAMRAQLVVPAWDGGDAAGLFTVDQLNEGLDVEWAWVLLDKLDMYVPESSRGPLGLVVTRKPCADAAQSMLDVLQAQRHAQLRDRLLEDSAASDISTEVSRPRPRSADRTVL